MAREIPATRSVELAPTYRLQKVYCGLDGGVFRQQVGSFAKLRDSVYLTLIDKLWADMEQDPLTWKRLTDAGFSGPLNGAALAGLGHRVEWWPDFTHAASAVCALRADKQTGVLSGRRPRRTSYALGW